MATIIDSLVVELGLDPSKWKAGQEEADRSVAKTRDAARKSATEWEGMAKKADDYLRLIQTQALKLAAIFLGGLGIEKAITDFAKLNAETGRAAHFMKLDPAILRQWEIAGETVGATVGEIRTSLNALAAMQAQWQMGLQPTSIAVLRTLLPGIDPLSMPVDQIMRMIAEKRSDLDPAMLAQFMSMIGAGPGMMNLVSLGGAGLNERLKEAKEVSSLTREMVKNAQEMEHQWVLMLESARSIKDVMANWSAPGLTAIMKWITGTETQGRKNLLDLTEGPGTVWERLKRFMLADPMFAWMGDGTPGGGGDGGPRVRSPYEAGGPLGTMTRSQTEAYIRDAAARRGIDPEIALAVARSEGLHDYVGDRGTSFGPYQLHYGGGLGDLFTKQTGLHARDPSTVRQQIDFALDQAAAGGWGPWHGWRGARFAGIGARPPGGGGSTTVNISTVNVTSTAADLSGVAADTFSGAFREAGLAALAQSGAR